MAVIVGVHGIAQENKNASMLEDQWLPAIEAGIRDAARQNDAAVIALADRLHREQRDPDGLNFGVAFYGDLFRSGQRMGTGADAIPEADASLTDTLAREWLERAAARASQPEQRQAARDELAELDGQAGVAQGPRKLIGPSIQSLAKLKLFANLGMDFAASVIVRSLAQVSSYFSDPEIRRAARDRVRALIGPETKIVIGHSLGSVVAYEVLAALDSPLPLFLTLGSPLGLNTIVYDRLEPHPPVFPACLKRWVNLADEDDFIAAAPNLTKYFERDAASTAIFESAYTVDNGAQPHSAIFYLAQLKSGQAIASTLIPAG